MKELFKGSLTVPNLLTFLRIVLIPIFALLFYNGQFIWAVFVLFLSGLSDFLDGKIARRFNQVSELGKILDPVADKLTQITIAVMLFFEFRAVSSEVMRAFSWVFLFFLFKEGIMVVGGMIMLSKGLRPGAAEMLGKIATFVFYGSMILIIAFGPEIGAFVRDGRNPGLVMPNWSVMALVLLSALLTFLALLGYIPETLRQFKEGKKDKKV
ncbi:MAG: CDP-alcohol phosphatidyltransferase family protein [Eubacteriales bacterium]